jgi:prevent-host-death family protein
MTVEVASRELRNDTGGLLRRVEEGETIVITRRGKPVADLVPHRRVASRWFTPDEVVEVIEKSAADPGLKEDLERLVGETTDDLGPIR